MTARAAGHAPTEAVHGSFARVVGRPAVRVARGGARANEDDPAALRARAQAGEGCAQGGDEAEDVDVKVRLPCVE